MVKVHPYPRSYNLYCLPYPICLWHTCK